VFVAIDRLGKYFLGIWVEDSHAWTGIGFLIAVGLITGMGIVSSRRLVVWFFAWIERQLLGSRITSGVYSVIHDTFSAIFGQRRLLTKAALVDFPEMGYQRIGFVTQESLSSLAGSLEGKVAVYFPHSFQVSGNMLIVPAKNIRPLDLSADKVLKMIMSGGIVQQ
jgi:uncharacterized membrane protein